MVSRDDVIDWAGFLGPPSIVISGFGLLMVLPTEIIGWVAAWVAASFPIGMLIGHCVLSEKLGGK